MDKLYWASFIFTVLLVSMAITAPVMAEKSNVITVTPTMVVEDIEGGSTTLSTEPTTLGSHSVKMEIPFEHPSTDYDEGVYTEVRRHGLGQLKDIASNSISFKVYVTAGPTTGYPKIFATTDSTIYVGIILRSPSQNLWVILIPSTTWGPEMYFSSTTMNEWVTATPAEHGYWVGWTYAGDPFTGTEDGTGGQPIERTLSEWSDYLQANYPNMNVDAVKILLGYRPGAWGTIYVDELQVNGHAYDFEP